MKNISVLLCLFVLSCQSYIDVNLSIASPFSDHMVVQQEDELTIWGWAQPDMPVFLETTWGSQSKTLTNSLGEWRFQLQTPKADHVSHQIILKAGDEKISIKDVLLGEVWLASGQSNMEMPMKGFQYSKPFELIEGADFEIPKANFPEIRMFTVKRTVAFKPQKILEGQWDICTPESILEFSAVGYFFAKKLHEKLNIPIGIIHSSWGGSPAESWSKLDFLEQINGFDDTEKRLKIANDPSTVFNKWIADRCYVEWDSLIRVDKIRWINQKNKIIVETDFDDENWQKATLEEVAQAFEKDNFNGTGWIRQKLVITENVTSDLVFNIGKTNDLYSIFINGELIGRKENWPDADTHYKIPKELLKKGVNVIAIRFIDVWGIGGLIQDEERGIFNKDEKIYNLKDKWSLKMTSCLADGHFYELKNGTQEIVSPSPFRMPRHSHSPTTLNNSMIAPLAPFAIKGFIWYQGETNASRAEQYKTLFPSVIDSWRDQWKDENLPFYYVQLAPFQGNSQREKKSKNHTAELREAQLLTLSKKNVGMVVTTDVGDKTSIHPSRKKPVGDRLALWALAKDYGFKELVYSGPIYRNVNFKNKKAVVTFDYIGSGLFSNDKELTDFEIAGENKKYVPAKAYIKENQVIVWSEKVSSPRYVRFGWKNYISPNLFNLEGLPASPFSSQN